MTPLNKQRALEARHRFAATIAGADFESVDLAHVALLIAAEEEARLDVAHYLALLDELGERARLRLKEVESDAVEVFNDFIFGELGFAGNEINYYDPHNSFLNYVLDHRTGIPITLSIVYMELGRRAGLKVEGVSFPGHFVVRAKSEGEEAVLVDAFHGKTLDRSDCEDLLASVYGEGMPLSEEYLRPAKKREILVRLLTNLKAIYVRANLHRQALSAVERILLLAPDSPNEHRDKSVMLAHLNQLDKAISETQLYLNSKPKPSDIEQVREHLYMLQKRQAMLN